MPPRPLALGEGLERLERLERLAWLGRLAWPAWGAGLERLARLAWGWASRPPMGASASSVVGTSPNR
ncbi:MAG: hypothetical protein QOF30_2805 [Acidimicrobiaceae bacterium]|nr:hypothetical protein [Acidimicrobiaceae bacterium]